MIFFAERIRNIFMGKVYLCGHTGSINRGCEAIVRSTVKILQETGYSKTATMTFRKEDDRRLHVDEVTELIPYRTKSVFAKAVSFLRQRLMQDWEWGARYSHAYLFPRLNQSDCLFNIGGDTYCYGSPYLSYALNRMAKEKNIPVVFWGCSVDERVLTDAQMQEDLNRYAYIVARETLSYEMLRQVVRDKERVYLACDPAFCLPVEPAELPDNFIPGNTLGLNVFPLGNRPFAWENITFFIEQVIDQTDMNICLIPHVYDAQKKSCDLEVLEKLYECYKSTGRMAIVRQELSCTQLKYIISQCRFFVGARTHSMIAAYSTKVPALALSYSIKSRGIARDILGDESYAVPWNKMKSKDVLWNEFEQKMIKNEAQIHQRYQEIFPEYKQSILTVCTEIMKKMGDCCE